MDAGFFGESAGWDLRNKGPDRASPRRAPQAYFDKVLLSVGVDRRGPSVLVWQGVGTLRQSGRQATPGRRLCNSAIIGDNRDVSDNICLMGQ